MEIKSAPNYRKPDRNVAYAEFAELLARVEKLEQKKAGRPPKQTDKTEEVKENS
jgi:hypothetical protein